MNDNLIKKVFTYKNQIKDLEKGVETGTFYKIKYEVLNNEFDSKVEKIANIKTNASTKEYQNEIHKMNKMIAELNKKIIKYDIEFRKLASQIKEKEEILLAKEKERKELEKQISKLKKKQNLDSNNSRISTSQTQINKATNTIENNKYINGQKGHAKSTLKIPTVITNEVDETLNQCTNCNSKQLIDTGKVISKYVTDYKIMTSNIKYNFKVYKCACCGKETHKKIPNNLKEEVQYGPIVKSQILTLANIGNIPINKIRRIISGLSVNITPSEGYISKLQIKASKNLDKFITDIKSKIIESSLVYWFDTVIFVNQKRNWVRLYGDDKLAFYIAHETKGKIDLDEDKILNLVNKDTWVMHGNNIVNYNEEYNFKNIECCLHLLRDLEKVNQNMPSRTWAKKTKELFSSFNNKRNKLIEKKEDKFKEDEITSFIIEFDENIALGYKENSQNSDNYSKEEIALLNRLVDYRDNYLYWLFDFNLPFANLSESSLGEIKSKMKVSRQFQNIKGAKDYARIKSYIETAHRNNIDESYALERLASDNPLTLEEMLNNRID